MKIKVVVGINSAANPELFSEISGIPTRSRAARIRNLATIGIASSNGIRGASLSLDLNSDSDFGKERHKTITKERKELVDQSSERKNYQQNSPESNEEQKGRRRVAKSIIRKLSRSL